MRHVLLVLLAAMGVVAARSRAIGADEISPGFHFVEVEGERGVVKGTIFVPRDLDLSEPAPTIVFLNGYGECGTDGSKNLGVGLPTALIWEPDRWPFIVVMPQKPEHNVDWDAYEDAVLTMLDLAVSDFGADPERVGITGLSQGGHGTIAIATHHPERFRAAAPVCGYTGKRFSEEGERVSFDTPTPPEEFERAASAMRDMAVWIFHGGRDDIVPPSEAEGLHAALEKLDAPDAVLTIFPDDNHNSWDSAYRKSGLWDWFADRLSSD